MTALEAHGLCKAWGGRRAVDDVSLAVSPGEAVALLGANGAGKSTLFALLGGQLRADAGRIVLAGRDATGAGPRALLRRGLARTFQVARVFASMTVRQNVQVALAGCGGAQWRLGRPMGRYRPDAAERLLGQVGLAEQSGRPAALLAYGDRKRLDLAIALAAAPRVLLMDEPVAGVAPQERGGLMRQVRGLARAQGLAVLFTEHDVAAALAAADRVIVLAAGRVLAQGTPAEMRADPRVREAYLGEDDAPGG